MDKDEEIKDLDKEAGQFSRHLISLVKRFYNYSRIERFYSLDLQKQEEYSKKYLRDENEK